MCSKTRHRLLSPSSPQHCPLRSQPQTVSPQELVTPQHGCESLPASFQAKSNFLYNTCFSPVRWEYMGKTRLQGYKRRNPKLSGSLGAGGKLLFIYKTTGYEAESRKRKLHYRRQSSMPQLGTLISFLFSNAASAEVLEP